MTVNDAVMCDVVHHDDSLVSVYLILVHYFIGLYPKAGAYYAEPDANISKYVRH